jgi:UrcA family protein
MNTREQLAQRSQYDSGRGKLALLGLCITLMTAAIAKQLPAQAAEPSATVSLVGLDLSTEQGLKTARDRLLVAARQLCGKVVDPWSVSHHPDYVNCVDSATADAMGQIQNSIRVAAAKSHPATASNR